MDIYQQKSRWKIYLAIVGVLIATLSMYYTNYLVKQLEAEEEKKVKIWASANERLSNAPPDDTLSDYTLHTEILEANTTIPVILVNDGGGIDGVRNFGEEKDNDPNFLTSNELQQELHHIKANGGKPIEIDGFNIYFKSSKILTLLKYFPLFQFILISAFILFGYLGFSNARRAEQNRVWVGMAKETAHQLGTPISAILGWIDHLKIMHEGDENTNEVIEELHKDVDRLGLIAERFSKIGSEPVLESINIYTKIEECKNYMQKRSPRHVVFDFPDPSLALMVKINPPLFDWVIENLLRNSLDAMDGKGSITAIIYEEERYTCIEITDSGKGIPANKFKTVFNPGYTTKKRGWGLGLSLAKRIIKDYHKGKIFVKQSIPNEATTFCIKLPKQV
jgi:Histidine kinase-, DNA gyrase B-, and HSP90-like ATPase